MSELSPEASALLRHARRAVEPDARSLREAQVALHEKLLLRTPSILCSAAESHASAHVSGADALANAVQRELPAKAQGFSATLVLKGSLAVLLTLAALALFLGRHQHASTVPVEPVASVPPAAAPAHDPTAIAEHPAPARASPALLDKAKPTVAARSGTVRNGSRKLRPSEPALASKPDAMLEPSPTAPPVLRRPSDGADASEPRTPSQAGQRGTVYTAGPRVWSISSLQRAGRQSSTVSKGRSAEDTPAPFAVDSLEHELEYLRKARAALQKKDSKLAIALLREHQARYPSGALKEERLATEVLAFCMEGETAGARESLQRLARIAPQSPYLAQLERSCVAD